MRVGIVGDLHEGFTHDKYLPYCYDSFVKYRVDRIHFIGDIVDNHAISFHDHNPNGKSAEDEAAAALARVAIWYNAFKGTKVTRSIVPAFRTRKRTVSIGNHDMRHFRLARKYGLPDRFVKSYADVWNTPEWDWAMSHVIDDVVYKHGTGLSGKNAAIDHAIQIRKSVVIGHLHSEAGVKYHTNQFDRIFGLSVGCGIDCRAYAFEYGQESPRRPVLGCGIVIDGDEAHFLPMPCGPGEKYQRGKRSAKC